MRCDSGLALYYSRCGVSLVCQLSETGPTWVYLSQRSPLPGIRIVMSPQGRQAQGEPSGRIMTPPFMTITSRSSTEMSLRGFPGTATRSAR